MLSRGDREAYLIAVSLKALHRLHTECTSRRLYALFVFAPLGIVASDARAHSLVCHVVTMINLRKRFD